MITIKGNRDRDISMIEDSEPKSISDLTRLVTDPINEYSYLDLNKLNKIAAYSNRNGNGFEQKNKKRHKVTAEAQSTKKTDRIPFGTKINREKYFKKAKRILCVSDHFREKRNQKPNYLEPERKINFPPCQLLKRYIKQITV